MKIKTNWKNQDKQITKKQTKILHTHTEQQTHEVHFVLDMIRIV